MIQVVAHIVSAERKHGKWITAYLTDVFGDGCCCNLGAHNGSHENAMLPVKALMNQGDGCGAASADQYGRDGNSGRIFPFRGDYGALLRRCGKPGIGMSSRFSAVRSPVVALPVNQMIRCVLVNSFPPDVSVIRQCNVGINGVLCCTVHGIGVGFVGGSRCHSKEPCFRIDGIQASVFSEFHPGNVVSDGFHFPARNGRNQHGQIGFPAGTWECSGYILYFAFRVGKLQNQHMLRQPAFISSLNGSNAEGETFFAQQCISAIAGTIGPDCPFFRELADIFFLHGGTGPGGILFPFLQRSAYGMQAGNKFTVSQDIQYFLSNTGHNAHVYNNVCAVGQFYTDFGGRGANRSH